MTESHATGQRSLVDGSVTHPLRPPLTLGCPDTGTDDQPVPTEVTYDYDAINPDLFGPPVQPGLERWAPILPPLSAPSLGAGGTPLVETPEIADWVGTDRALYLKDESANPTWSHKDRLNRLTVSAAVENDAEGIVAASTGNHGASAAAHAARADLPCVVFTKSDNPEPMQGFVQSYGAGLLRVESWPDSRTLVNEFVDRGWHPVTSRTDPHVGHPYGPEGYKTIAYEIHAQVQESGDAAVPGTVLAPTAHAELLYGVWKGFRELDRLGVVSETPAMVACEPGTQASLVEARRRGEPITTIEAGPSDAHSIGGSTSTHRGYYALEESGGDAVAVPEETMVAARDRLADAGFWQELSGAASVGGLRAADRSFDGPIVALACSSGFKDGSNALAPTVDPEFADVQATLADEYGMTV